MPPRANHQGLGIRLSDTHHHATWYASYARIRLGPLGAQARGTLVRHRTFQLGQGADRYSGPSPKSEPRRLWKQSSVSRARPPLLQRRIQPLTSLPETTRI